MFKVHDCDLIYSSPKEQITGQEQADLLVFAKHSLGPLNLSFCLKPYLSVAPPLCLFGGPNNRGILFLLQIT